MVLDWWNLDEIIIFEIIIFEIIAIQFSFQRMVSFTLFLRISIENCKFDNFFWANTPFFFDSLEIPGDAIVGLNRIKSPRIHEQKFRWCTQPLYSRLSFPMFGFSMKFLSCYQSLSRNINKFEMSFSDIFIIESNWKKFYSDYARRLLIKRKGLEIFLERCLIF